MDALHQKNLNILSIMLMKEKFNKLRNIRNSYNRIWKHLNLPLNVLEKLK